MRAVECRESKASLRAVLLLGLLLFAQGTAQAEQLSVRTYTTADGLPRDFVLRIVRDSHGFLWFCTADGLSRFNAYEFTTYSVEHQLTGVVKSVDPTDLHRPPNPSCGFVASGEIFNFGDVNRSTLVHIAGTPISDCR